MPKKSFPLLAVGESSDDDEGISRNQQRETYGTSEESGIVVVQPTAPMTLTQLRAHRFRLPIRILAFLAVAREPLFSALVGESAVKSERTLVQLAIGGPVNRATLNALIGITAPFVLANLSTDLSAIDAAALVDRFLSQPQEKNMYKRWLVGISVITATVLSYISGTLSDALPLEDVINSIVNAIIRNAVRYTVLAPIVILGVIYYSMMLNPRIREHCDELVDSLENPMALLRDIRKNWPQYLEVFIETTGNAGYRGISFGSFLYLFCGGYIEVNNQSNLVKVLVYLTGSVTFGVTYISRLMPVKELFINDNYRKLIAEDFSEARVSIKGLIPEVGFTIVRAASVAILIYEGLPPIFPLQLSLSLLTGSLVAGHSLYTRYLRLLCADAWHKKQEQNMRVLTSTFIREESTPLLETPSLNLDREVDDIKPEPTIDECWRLFKGMVEQQKTANLSTCVLVINIMTRIIRLIGFAFFVESLAEGLGLNLSYLQIFIIALLWASEVFNSDRMFYQSLQENTIAGHVVKIAAQRQEDAAAVGKTPSEMSWTSTFLSGVKAVLKSPLDYAEQFVANAQQAVLTGPING